MKHGKLLHSLQPPRTLGETNDAYLQEFLEVYGSRDTRPIDTKVLAGETMTRLEKVGDFIALAEIDLTVEKGGADDGLIHVNTDWV